MPQMNEIRQNCDNSNQELPLHERMDIMKNISYGYTAGFRSVF